MFKPRTYQTEKSEQGYKILNSLGILVLSMEVRTGKTFTALMTCEKAKAKHVLFITKKKAISSIQADYNTLNPSFDITIINFESVHKIDTTTVDVIIVDESHSLGAYPKPSQRTKKIKAIVGNKRLILMSGTLTPESYSQIYHQFWISENSPFVETSFYKWANNYVNVTRRMIAGNYVNDYSKANRNLIQAKISKHILTYTQSQAGFTSTINEKILKVKMKPSTYALVKKLERDLVVEGKNGGVILADTSVKLMQKVHQIYSGTCKLEDGSTALIDDSKAKFIFKTFFFKKIAIFYKFKAELKLLKNVFGEFLTTDLEEFNTTNKNIALQIVSGREGISLSKADCLVMYNIEHSSTSYWQSRDRLTTKSRMINDVYWIFSEGGIEEEIYKVVQEKKHFTLDYYKKWKQSKTYAL